jgi:group I intron endonuclease
MPLIYCITNTVTGKRYIGQTIRPKEQRWQRHLNDAQNKSIPFALHKSIRKHGPGAFKVEQLTTCDESQLDWLEQFFIWLYDTQNRKHGYNMTEGGGGRRGHKVSEASRRKLSEARTGIKFSEEHCRKISQSHIGKARPPFSEDTRLKMSKAQSNRSPEHRAKIRANALKRWQNPEHRAKVAATLAARKHLLQ